MSPDSANLKRTSMAFGNLDLRLPSIIESYTAHRLGDTEISSRIKTVVEM